MKSGEIIYDKYREYDGFVVLHGTDTMAYTASALSFMLEETGGAHRVADTHVRSDARDNLITSLTIAADGVVNEVCLYFGGKLHHWKPGHQVQRGQARCVSLF